MSQGASKIVVIEDDEIVCSTIKKALESKYDHVSTFTDPELGIKALEEIQPDLLLLDIFRTSKWYRVIRRYTLSWLYYARNYDDRVF